MRPIKAPVALGVEPVPGLAAAGAAAQLGQQDRPCPALHPKMPRPSQCLSLLLLPVLAATAQGQTGTGPKVLEPWLLGLTAVVVFLFIVFVVLIINRFWNLRMRRKHGDYPETTGTDRLERIGHVNPAAEDSDEESEGKRQSHATAL